MAEETPENLEAASAAETPAPTPAEPAPASTRRDRLDQRRAARQAARGSQGPRTLEERIAEREAHRERNARQRRAYRAKQKAKRAELRASQPAAEPVQASERSAGKPKIRQGVVVSDKADKTITVRVDVAHRHKRYHKIMRTSSTFHVHDERNDAHAGDTVRIVECRPMSRFKRWRLVEVLERAR